MDTKVLLTGIISFIAGGLLVATAASFEKQGTESASSTHSSSSFSSTTVTTDMHTSMDSMTSSLGGETGDDFDREFIKQMIIHHEGAVAMAKLAETQAKHDEIKQLSGAIMTAQTQEIGQMRAWQQAWGYTSSDDGDSVPGFHGHGR
ncbi:DUF305 domain-containing protein [Candidatus Saccharibacteria bacterium]|nr:DUF305 domain-containing protein [Candidatus Saccharibacteria bacterium]